MMTIRQRRRENGGSGIVEEVKEVEVMSGGDGGGEAAPSLLLWSPVAPIPSGQFPEQRTCR